LHKHTLTYKHTDTHIPTRHICSLHTHTHTHKHTNKHTGLQAMSVGVKEKHLGLHAQSCNSSTDMWTTTRNGKAHAHTHTHSTHLHTHTHTHRHTHSHIPALPTALNSRCEGPRQPPHVLGCGLTGLRREGRVKVQEMVALQI